MCFRSQYVLCSSGWFYLPFLLLFRAFVELVKVISLSWSHFNSELLEELVGISGVGLRPAFSRPRPVIFEAMASDRRG